jgi:hypothetical protein
VSDGSSGSPLSPADFETLSRIREQIKASRKDTTNPNAAIAKAAKLQVLALLSYLTGLLDSKGLFNAASSTPGADLLFGPFGPPSVDDILDEIEAGLDTLLAPEARLLDDVAKAIGHALTAVGDAISSIAQGAKDWINGHTSPPT